MNGIKRIVAAALVAAALACFAACGLLPATPKDSYSPATSAPASSSQSAHSNNSGTIILPPDVF